MSNLTNAAAQDLLDADSFGALAEAQSLLRRAIIKAANTSEVVAINHLKEWRATTLRASGYLSIR